MRGTLCMFRRERAWVPGVMLDGRLRRGETNKCGEIGYNVFFEDYKRTARAAGA